MLKSINLSDITYLFNKGKHLKLKRCNLIFGKNASGKSSIANYINSRYGVNDHDNDTDVFLFNKDFMDKNVEKGDELNALSLGSKDIQTHDKLVHIISKIHNHELIKEKYEKSYSNYNDTYSKFRSNKSKWLTDCARDIRNNHFELIKDPNYNKNNFYYDLRNNAKLLPNEYVNKLTKILHEPVKKEIHLNNKLPILNINDILNKVNKLLSLKMKSKHIKSLAGITNKDKKNFAVEGMKIHNQNDICAFCGNKITSTRWTKLHELFNNKYFQLMKQIQNSINSLMTYEDKLSKISELNIKGFYLKYQSKAKSVNYKIVKLRLDYNNFFNYLINLLKTKKGNIDNVTHISLHSQYVVNLESFNTLRADINDIINKNNNYHNRMSEIKDKARNAILFSLVASKKKRFTSKNPKFNIEFHNTKNNFNKSYKRLLKIKNQLSCLYHTKRTLLQKDRDKNVVVRNINKYLSFLGDSSFRLYYDNSHNGEYYVSSKRDGKRSVHTLSRGERNLISFLYFYYLISPDNPNNKNSNNKIIIFDDPMDSNDVDFQYLMVTLLQRLIHNIDDKVNKKGKKGNIVKLKNETYKRYQLIIFTHNVNFYLNIKYNLSKKLHLIHLIRTSKGTDINYIKNDTQDFCNSYQELWAETVYLYNQHQADFMINPIRRIIETFIKFNAISTSIFYKDHPSAKKLFDVNSHDIEDISTNANGHTCDSIKHMFKKLFYDNGNKKHFDNCWNKFRDYGNK